MLPTLDFAVAETPVVAQSLRFESEDSVFGLHFPLFVLAGEFSDTPPNFHTRQFTTFQIHQISIDVQKGNPIENSVTLPAILK